MIELNLFSPDRWNWYCPILSHLVQTQVWSKEHTMNIRDTPVTEKFQGIRASLSGTRGKDQANSLSCNNHPGVILSFALGPRYIFIDWLLNHRVESWEECRDIQTSSSWCCIFLEHQFCLKISGRSSFLVLKLVYILWCKMKRLWFLKTENEWFVATASTSSRVPGLGSLPLKF